MLRRRGQSRPNVLGSPGLVELAAERVNEWLELTYAASMQRVFGVPLDSKRQDHIVGVQNRAIVEGDASPKRTGPRGQLWVRIAGRGQRWSHRCATGKECV